MTSQDNYWKVIEFNEDEPTVLFHQRKGQKRPQPVYMEIDTEKKTISADWSGDRGITEPKEDFDEPVIRFSIPPLTAKAANELMDCVKTILDETDLSKSESVETGRAKIANVIEEYQEAPQVEAWEAADWLEPMTNEFSHKIKTSEMTIEQLSSLIEEEGTNAVSDGNPVVLLNVDDYLEQFEELQEESMKK